MRLASAFLIGLLFVAAAASAQTGPAAAGEDRLAAVAQELVGAPPEARMAGLRSLFAAVAGEPNAVAALATAVLKRLDGPPLAVADAAEAVYRAATEAMAAAPVYRVVVDPLFALPASHRGWDLGPPASPLASGFASAGAAQLVPGPGGIRGLAGGDDPLIADALLGVAGFRAKVADGSYRLIVLTREDALPEPLGERIVVNGAPVPLARPAPAAWIERAYLMPTALQEAGSARRRNGASGGALVTTVDVVGGRLVIDFAGGALVSAVILEPLGAPSVLIAPEPAEDRVLAAESAVAAVVGRLFEAVASAAGPEAVRAVLDDLPETPVDPRIYRSPS